MTSDVRYNNFSRRLLAFLIDGLIFLPLNPMAGHLWAVASPPVRVAMYVFQLSLFLIYSIVLHGVYGQTLGKRLCGIRVYDLTGRPLSMRQAILRDSPQLAFFLAGLCITTPMILRGYDPGAHAPTSWHEISRADRILQCVSVAWYVADLIAVWKNSQQRALHDLLAGSVVLRAGARTVAAVDPRA